jgi:hypothetical protein
MEQAHGEDILPLGDSGDKPDYEPRRQCISTPQMILRFRRQLVSLVGEAFFRFRNVPVVGQIADTVLPTS